jgi:hypothetical protein
VVIACLDERYLHRFGARLRDSLAPFGDVALHFHVATDNPQNIEPFLGHRVNYSFEPEPHFSERIHYCQSMRFLRMLELLIIYKRPLLFVDADAYFLHNPSELFELNAKIHVGLNNNRRAYVPWRKFKAECVYVDGGPRGLRFARCLRNLLLNLYSSNYYENHWIDQAILAHAVEAVAIHGEGVNIVDNRATGWTGLHHH